MNINLKERNSIAGLTLCFIFALFLVDYLSLQFAAWLIELFFGLQVVQIAMIWVVFVLLILQIVIVGFFMVATEGDN